MELSVREAAALMGRSPRTVRAQLARGDLPGKKRNGQWRVPRSHIPLTEAQRNALQDKAETIRKAVDEVLPSRTARTRGQKTRSVLDLDAFRYGADLLRDLREHQGDALPETSRRRVVEQVEEALLALTEAVQLYDRRLKLEALQRTRVGLARATGLLLLEAKIPPPEPIAGWVGVLEGHLIPAVAGFARWADQLGSRRS